MYKIVLMRHGESQWNLENRFTGWVDVDLTEKGRQEAARAGEILKAEGFEFDLCYTSVLKRAERTSLRSASGTEQKRDSGKLWRRTGSDLAPLL